MGNLQLRESLEAGIWFSASEEGDCKIPIDNLQLDFVGERDCSPRR